MMRGASAAGAALLALLAVSGCLGTDTREQPATVARGAPAPNVSGTGRVVVDGGGEATGNDDYVLNSATIAGDTLTISASYSGGCETHAMTLVIAASFVDASPVRLPAILAHEANGDRCEAWLTQSHAFALDLVRARYRETYGPGAGSVLLDIQGAADERLVYEFDG